jgi:hypothetical protein
MSLLNAVIKLATAGAGIYTAYQTSKAAREGASAAQKAARAQEKKARIAQQQAIEETKTRIQAAKDRADSYAATISELQGQTGLIRQQAEQARAASSLSIAEQKRASALALQQQQLASEVQQQQMATTGPVSSRVRKRVGTPAALRTSVEVKSPLSGGMTGGASSMAGGLNV